MRTIDRGKFVSEMEANPYEDSAVSGRILGVVDGLTRFTPGTDWRRTNNIAAYNTRAVLRTPKKTGVQTRRTCFGCRLRQWLPNSLLRCPSREQPLCMQCVLSYLEPPAPFPPVTFRVTKTVLFAA